MIKLGKFASVEERLFRNYEQDKIRGCWLYLGSRNMHGYGIMRIKGKSFRVHRISYEYFIGPLINDALHMTECPNRNCFNPTHLYDGTDIDNMNDKRLKWRK